MSYADLHMHTCFSDGTQTPEEVIREAAEKGLSVISVCDHDTVAAYELLRPACEKAGIRLIQGTEIDVLWRDRTLHLLAYGFDAESAGLLALLNKARFELDEVSVRMLRNMQADFPALRLEDYEAYACDPRLGGWKCLHFLMDRGYARDYDECLSFYARYGTGKPDYPALSDACRVVRAAGGVPVLAHPGNWWPDLPADFGDTLDALRKDGIGGIECHYPAHSEALTRACTDFCREHGLAVTCGGDGHGTFNRIVDGVEYGIGIIKVPMEQMDLRGIV